MKRVPLSLVLMSLLFLGSYIPTACACSCREGTDEEKRSSVDVIFVGVAVSEYDSNPEYQNSPEDPSHQTDKIEWTFDVEHVEKGSVGETATVATARGGSVCGFRFKQGSRYHVFAYRLDDQSLKTSNCTGTREMNAGQTATPSPSPPEPSPSSPPPSPPPPPEPPPSPIQETPFVSALSSPSGPPDVPIAIKGPLTLSGRAERPLLEIASLASLTVPLILLTLTFATQRFAARRHLTR